MITYVKFVHRSFLYLFYPDPTLFCNDGPVISGYPENFYRLNRMDRRSDIIYVEKRKKEEPCF